MHYIYIYIIYIYISFEQRTQGKMHNYTMCFKERPRKNGSKCPSQWQLKDSIRIEAEAVSMMVTIVLAITVHIPVETV